MDAFLSAVLSLAVVAVAGAGFATIAGLAPLRDRLLGVAVVLVVGSLAVRIFVAILAPTTTSVGLASGPKGTTFTAISLVVPFLLGHVTLAVAILKRRRRGHGGATSDADEVERARGRGRPRASSQHEGSDQ